MSLFKSSTGVKSRTNVKSQKDGAHKAQHPLFQMAESRGVISYVTPTYETLMRRVTAANINDTHILKKSSKGEADENEIVGTPLMLAVYKDDVARVERLLRDFNPNIEKKVVQLELTSFRGETEKKALGIAIAHAKDGSMDATTIINSLVDARAEHDIDDIIEAIGRDTPSDAIYYLKQGINEFKKRTGIMESKYNVLEHAVSVRRLDIFNIFVSKVDLNDPYRGDLGLGVNPDAVNRATQQDKPVIWMLAAYWLSNHVFYVNDGVNDREVDLDFTGLQSFIQTTLIFGNVVATNGWLNISPQYSIDQWNEVHDHPIVDPKMYTDFYGALLDLQNEEGLRPLLVKLDVKIKAIRTHI